MTDEEMAEEYIEKNCKIWEEGELTVDEIVRLAFLAGLKADHRLLEQRGSDILKELLDKNKRCKELERQIEKMKYCCNCDWFKYLPNGNCLDCGKELKNWKLKE